MPRFRVSDQKRSVYPVAILTVQTDLYSCTNFMTSLHQKDPHNFKQGGTVIVLRVGDEPPTHTRRCRREATTEAIACCLPTANTGPPLCYQARTERRGCTGARRGPPR